MNFTNKQIVVGSIWETRGGQVVRIIKERKWCQEMDRTLAGVAELLNHSYGSDNEKFTTYTFFSRGRWATDPHDLDLVKLIAIPIPKKVAKYTHAASVILTP